MDKIEKRLIVLYALESFTSPISREQLATLVVNSTLLSWIDVQLTLRSLEEDKLIANYKESKISITSAGKEIVKVYRDDIPENTRFDIKAYIDSHKNELLRETINQSHFKKVNDEFLVSLSITENSKLLFNLEFLLPNRESAEKICNNWKEHSNVLYKEILEILLNSQIIYP